MIHLIITGIDGIDFCLKTCANGARNEPSNFFKFQYVQICASRFLDRQKSSF